MMKCACCSSPMHIVNGRVVPAHACLVPFRKFLSATTPFYLIEGRSIVCNRETTVIKKIGHHCWDVECMLCHCCFRVVAVGKHAFIQQGRHALTTNCDTETMLTSDIERYIRFTGDEPRRSEYWGDDADFEYMFSNDKEVVVGSCRLPSTFPPLSK